MSIAAFAKVQVELARCIGRRDFDRAVQVLNESLSNSEADVPSLVLIAQCHRSAGRDDMAIASAQRALAYDPRNFGSIRLMSEIYAKRREHDTAARYVRLGLESYPEPLPPMPKIFFRLLRVLAAISPRLRRIEASAREDLGDRNKENAQWYGWAKEYLAWYDARSGNRQAPRVH